MSIQNFEYDQIDRKIARILSEDASLTNAEIGNLVGLSASATNERIRKLKSNGKIKKVVAFVDSDFMDMEMCAFIFVLVDGTENCRSFLESILDHENICECHHMTGEYSYLLKVRVKNTKGLEDFISNFLKTKAGIVKTMTQIVLSSVKENSVVVG